MPLDETLPPAMNDALAAAIQNDHDHGLHEDVDRVDPHECGHPRCSEAYWHIALRLKGHST